MGWRNWLFGGGKQETMEAGMATGPPKAMPWVKMAKDPVCGMEVDRGRAAATSVYQGQTYYFCAVGCKRTFDQNPTKYSESTGHLRGGSCC